MLEVEYLADIKVGVYEAPTIPKAGKFQTYTLKVHTTGCGLVVEEPILFPIAPTPQRVKQP
jgi:hypothetical protein